MTTDLTNVGRLQNSLTSSLVSRSQMATDFEAEETMILSWDANESIGDLWALLISAASYQVFLLNSRSCIRTDSLWGFYWAYLFQPGGFLVLVSAMYLSRSLISLLYSSEESLLLFWLCILLCGGCLTIDSSRFYMWCWKLLAYFAWFTLFCWFRPEWSSSLTVMPIKRSLVKRLLRLLYFSVIV